MAPPVSLPLPAEVVEFIESGVVGYVATRDGDLAPSSTLVMGAHVAADGTTVTLLIPMAVQEKLSANLREAPVIAATFTRPITNQSVQIKGTVTSAGPANEDHRVHQLRYLAALEEQLSLVGVPRSAVRRFVAWPALAVDLNLTAVFEQTPGPAAGRSWADGSRGAS